jgi:LAS superfamily LD-carboxypeptidase LdcB
MDELELTGRARTHIIDLERPRCALHYEVVASLLAMRDAAARAGIDLVPASSFRDFSCQVELWNRKWRGERALYDRSGRRLDHAALGERELVDAILCWSAVPGGSRHHWGSDIDVIDAAAGPAGYQPQLVPAEYAPGGVYARLSGWLDENMQRYGFHRPYASDRGGTAVEPWHLSYGPVANPAIESLSLPVLKRAITDSDLLGKQQVLDRLPEIYTRFILAVDVPPPAPISRPYAARA